jgi:hypothetical protein
VELEFETIESEQMDFLNRSCAVALDLESMLLRDLGQNPFSTVSTQSGHGAAVGTYIKLGMAVTALGATCSDAVQAESR